MSYSVDDDEEAYNREEYSGHFEGESFSKGIGHYGPDNDDDVASVDQSPKILLMGLRRSGKSSIQHVVFQKLAPSETLFLESTHKVKVENIPSSSFVQLRIMDFPGQINFLEPSFDSEKIFGGQGALVFVIDAQDDYMDAVIKLSDTAKEAHRVNPKLKFEVLIHKVDTLSDDSKMEIQRDIQQRATDFLGDHSNDLHLTYHQTSIYDHSIFEAFSKIIQKLIPQLPTLENLLNLFISTSKVEKAFLFDVWSKVYIATDSNPVYMHIYELCCDMIDVVIDISNYYCSKGDDFAQRGSFYHETYSIIKLNRNFVLYLRGINRYWALVCVIPEDNFTRPGLIDYNFLCLRKAILKVFDPPLVSCENGGVCMLEDPSPSNSNCSSSQN